MRCGIMGLVKAEFNITELQLLRSFLKVRHRANRTEMMQPGVASAKKARDDVTFEMVASTFNLPIVEASVKLGQFSQ